MLTRELFADALQDVAAPASGLQDRAHAHRVADLCLRAFETQFDVTAEITRTGGGRDLPMTARDEQIPDIRVYDAAEHDDAGRSGAAAMPLPLLAVTRRARTRRSAPGAA